MKARNRVALLVAATVAGAGAAIGFAAGGIHDALANELAQTLAFLGATILLQLFALKLPGRGSVSVSAVGLIGAAITLGTEVAMAIGVLAAVVQWLKSRGFPHRALFDAANLALSAGAGGIVFEQVSDLDGSGIVQVAAAVLAGLAYTAVNHGLLSLAMAASETRHPVTIWHERFHWARFHFLAFGALGLLAASADAQLGAAALAVFVVPPLLLALSMRDALGRSRSRAA